MDPSYMHILANLIHCPGARDWWNIYSDAKVDKSCEVDTCEKDVLPSVQQHDPIIPTDMAAVDTNQQSSQVEINHTNSELESPRSVNLSNIEVVEMNQQNGLVEKKPVNSVLEIPSGSNPMALSNMDVGETSQLNSQVKKNLRNSSLKIQKSDDLSATLVDETSSQKKNLRNSALKIPKSDDLSAMAIGETSQLQSQAKKKLRSSVRNIPKPVVNAYTKFKNNQINSQVKKKHRKSESGNSRVKNNPTNSEFEENPLIHEIIVDVDDFQYEEITVDIVDDCLVIHGERDENPEDPALVSMMFTRKYKIPHFVDKNKITRYVVEDGMVKIVCPKKVI